MSFKLKDKEIIWSMDKCFSNCSQLPLLQYNIQPIKPINVTVTQYVFHSQIFWIGPRY